MDFRADIHCHSNCSDGSDAPCELLRLAKIVGLQGISVTDHDTCAAYNSEFFSLAGELSIRVITGIEISCEFEGAPVHVLGYGHDVCAPSFVSFVQGIQVRRMERNRFILQKLRDKNLLIDSSELEKKEVFGRPHIAALLVKKRYVRSTQEAFERYLKDGACCWVPERGFSPTETIRQIRMAGGKAILAHPHFYKKGSWLDRLLSFPFDGIECYYGALPNSQEAPWVKLAEEKKWIVTGGSDYHGVFKPHISLGSSWVGEAVFDLLYTAHRRS